jgi:hypothetical protein
VATAAAALHWLDGNSSLAAVVAVVAVWQWRAKLPPAVAAVQQSDGNDGSVTAWGRWRQRRRQLGSSVAAAPAWRQPCGGGSLVAVVVAKAGLRLRLGMVVVATAAAWQQLGGGQIQKKTRKSNHSNLIRQSVSENCYGTWETVQKYVPMDIFFEKQN